MKLGTIIKIVGGGTPSKSDESYWNGNIPWASVKDMKGTELWSTIDHISQAGVENSATTLIDPGAIIMATRMAPGRVIKNRIQTAINQDLKAIYPSKNVDVDFLFYFFKSKEGYFENEATGATVKGIKIEHIANIEIPLPPLTEQKRISGILDAADRLRQQDMALIGCYNQLAQSVFLEMFGDPVRNERGWEVKTLAELGCKTQIGPFGSQLHQEDYISGGIPLVNPTHIKNLQIEPDFDLTLTQEKFESLPNYHLAKGDIIMGRRGEMGRCALVTERENGWFCGTGSLYIRPPKEINPRYLLLSLTSKRGVQYFEKEAQGVTMANLNKGIVNDFKLGIPPLRLQQKFATVIENIEDQKYLAEASLSESEALFQSLLQSAFKGEL